MDHPNHEVAKKQMNDFGGNACPSYLKGADFKAADAKIVEALTTYSP